MNHAKTALVAAIAAIAIIIAFFALSHQDSGSSVKIGFFAPLTGEGASWGQSSLAGAQLAVNEFNQKGGINGKKIELIVSDSKCTPDGGLNSANKLMNFDNVLGVAAANCSSEAAPAVPIAQRTKTPLVLISISAPGITGPGKDYVFRVYPSDKFQGKEAAMLVFQKLKKEKIALFFEKSEWSEGLKGAFSKEFEKLGGKIVYESSVLPVNADFKTEIAKMKETDAQAIYLLLFPANAMTALKEFKESNVQMPVIGADNFTSVDLIESELAEGVVFTVPKISMPEEFSNRVKSLPGFKDLKLSLSAPLAYDAVTVLLNAIEKAGFEKSAIRNEIARTSYAGVSNPLIEFDKIGDLKKAVYEIKIIKNKKLEDFQQ